MLGAGGSHAGPGDGAAVWQPLQALLLHPPVAGLTALAGVGAPLSSKPGRHRQNKGRPHPAQEPSGPATQAGECSSRAWGCQTAAPIPRASMCPAPAQGRDAPRLERHTPASEQVAGSLDDLPPSSHQGHKHRVQGRTPVQGGQGVHRELLGVGIGPQAPGQQRQQYPTSRLLPPPRQQGNPLRPLTRAARPCPQTALARPRKRAAPLQQRQGPRREEGVRFSG